MDKKLAHRLMQADSPMGSEFRTKLLDAMEQHKVNYKDIGDFKRLSAEQQENFYNILLLSFIHTDLYSLYKLIRSHHEQVVAIPVFKKKEITSFFEYLTFLLIVSGSYDEYSKRYDSEINGYGYVR